MFGAAQMTKEMILVRISCTFATPMALMDDEDYLRPLDITIMGWDSKKELWRNVGKVFADLVLWSQAELDGVSLFDVCDGDSQGWYEVHQILTEDRDDIRRDLELDDLFHHVLFIYDLFLVEALTPHFQPILDSVANLFGESVIVAMWLEDGLCSQKHLAELGFRKIAGERLIYRHNAHMTDFARKHPRGLNVEFEATETHESWFDEEMKRRFPHGYMGIDH